ncbi:uncharacterized protein LOC111872201 [Cryptotermes secundus]|uniref:uncharacterized protein LOC111872201 n=1 Tax=Cryptotermes secundus TaxID=105785 RepID=UPI001454BA7C|nr:uncharacterized protein LOC111872201 [Cryptotermes secundus]
MEDNYTMSSGSVSNLKSEAVEGTSAQSDSTIFGLETVNKDIIVKSSEGNLQSNIDDFGIESEHYDMLTNNEIVLPFGNSINDSEIKSGDLLKPLKNENNDYCMPHDNSFCLRIIDNSEELETVYPTVTAKQENRTVLSRNCEVRGAEDLIQRTCGTEPEGSFPLSVDFTQYDEVNERKRKRKRRNKKRKGRSTETIEILQGEDRAAVQERRKMVAVVSVFAASIFLTAVLLIVITLHMSQTLHPKALNMGGVPENLTAGSGEQDDHKILHDVATHFGADTRSGRDNKILTQYA